MENVGKETMFSSLVFLLLGAFSLISLASAECKATPSNSSWPSTDVWAAFNSSLGGQLIQPTPPGAVCHADQADYNATACVNVQTEWETYPFHRADPVSSAWNNYNNDTCLPDPTYSCSGEGYPFYVVNATTEEHVVLGVQFARQYGIRLIVKATGHDYMGRSSAPNSLSIWTYNLKGITFHDTFTPTNCSTPINTTAVTVAAGYDMIELYALTDAQNQTIVGGEAWGVGIGGYLTGAGHSALSADYGLAADNVLEVRVVTPTGSILVANECQNSDLFYAFRGGGGGTFGVLLSATIKSYPTMAYAIMTLEIILPSASDVYWDIMTYMLSQYPYLSENGVSGYPYMYPVYPVSATEAVAVYEATWHDHHSPYGSSNLSATFAPIITFLNTPFPGVPVTSVTKYYTTRYQAALDSHDISSAGEDIVVGSRLLDVATLSGNQTALKEALIGFTGTGAGSVAGPFLLGGRGVWDAVPRGGGDAVNPAWRKALAHVTTQLTWTPQNRTQKAAALTQITEKVQYLRDLLPDSGAYVNEANINEPNWQETFWGSNYETLVGIKKKYDPEDVLWCHPCVGNEGWEEVGDALCRV